MSRSVPASAERFRREDRLRHRSSFLRCYRAGRKRHGNLATLHYHPSEASGPRLGITASRRVGNAVARHRLKRWVRETFRRWPQRADLHSVDIVVHLKPRAAQTAFAEFRRELERQLRYLIRRPRR